jgi:acetyl esterase/lipase
MSVSSESWAESWAESRCRLARQRARTRVSRCSTRLTTWPITHLSPEAPPTLLIHGTHDTLVPIAAAHAFHQVFEAVAPGRAILWPIRGAQHAFEVFWSRRGAYAVDAAACWLEARFRAGP